MYETYKVILALLLSLSTGVLGYIIGISRPSVPTETPPIQDFIAIIDSKDLTAEMLTSRMGGNKIIIEHETGTVTDDEGNGIDSEGYYISYKYVGFPVHKGMKIETYFVHDPSGNDVDEIIARYDYPLE